MLKKSNRPALWLWRYKRHTKSVLQNERPMGITRQSVKLGEFLAKVGFSAPKILLFSLDPPSASRTAIYLPYAGAHAQYFIMRYLVKNIANPRRHDNLTMCTMGQQKMVKFCPCTGGHRIVQILCSQGIVLLRNRTKWGLVLSTFRKAVFWEKKKAKNHTISGNSYYLVRFKIVLYQGLY